MTEPDYKRLLLDVLQELAHMEDGGADWRLGEHLINVRTDAIARHDEPLRLAVEDAIKHLTLHQSRRLLDKSSGRSGG